MSARKSTRARRSIKYTNDVFKGLDVFTSESDEDAAEEENDLDRAEDEEAFNEATAGRASASDKEDEYGPNDTDDLISDESEGDFEDESLDGFTSSGEKSEASSRTGTKRKRQSAPRDGRVKLGMSEQDENHTQGLIDPRKNYRKQLRIHLTWGSGHADLVALKRAREQWNDLFIWPTRSSLHQSFYYSNEQQRREATEGWQWFYEDGGVNGFKSRQDTALLDAADVERYLPKPRYESLTVLMGPVALQKLFDIRTGDSVHLSEAWPTPGATADQTLESTARSGWLLNIGARIQCLEWVPHCSGNAQYLLVSAFHTAHEKTQNTPEADARGIAGTAFVAHSPYPSSFQIWKLNSSLVDGRRFMDPTSPPSLEYVFCFEWGTPRQLKWCPMQPRAPPVGSERGAMNFGLLAGVWSDGCVRVLEIRPSNDRDGTQYIRVDSVVFESRPPDTVCTCVAWLSSKCIVVGCANGCVAIWDISSYTSASSQRPSSVEAVRPFFYQPIHETYVQHVVSLHPSRPHMLASASMSGYFTVTDLSKCQGPSASFASADSVASQRTRFGFHAFAFQDVTQSVLFTDENYFVKGVPIRHAPQEHRMACLGAAALDLATTTLHPTILTGCADGFAFGTTAFDRLQERRAAAGAGWKSAWFKHEWRDALPSKKPDEGAQAKARDDPGTSKEGEDGGQNGDSTQTASKTAGPKKKGITRPDFGRPGDRITTHDLPTPDNETDSDRRRREELLARPMSRFTEGFKPDRTNIVTGDRVGFVNQINGVIFATIYTEEMAVTRVCWNPNLPYGTWAAAGMGSGLLRVEDLAVE